MASVFTESLYSPEELRELDLAIEHGHFAFLTQIVDRFGKMDRAKEADMNRVLNILRPPAVVQDQKSLIEKAVASKTTEPAAAPPSPAAALPA